jgi:hypothetical protein
MRARLYPRRTQIVPYELLAAVSGMLIFAGAVGVNSRLLHFIDSSSALNIVLKGASRQQDLNAISGYLWYRLCRYQGTYWAKYVPSALNLADGPSRGDFRLMKALSAEQVDEPFPNVHEALDLFESPIIPSTLVM